MNAANDRLRRWRDKQRASGKCIACTRKAIKGGKRCREHTDAQREVQAKYRASVASAGTDRDSKKQGATT